MNPEKKTYRPQELAEALDESLANVYRWIRLGRIRVIRPAKKILITSAEFDRIIQGEFITRRN